MLSKRRQGAIYLVLSVLIFIFFHLPDYIEKFRWWKSELNEVGIEWQGGWNYVLLSASFSFLAWGISLFFFRTPNAIPDPDCTLPQLIQALTDKYPDFEGPVTTDIGFILESHEAWIEKLSEGKILVWGRKTKYDNPEDPMPPLSQIRRSPFTTQIPEDFWQHNRIDLSGQYPDDVVQTGKAKPDYTQIEFNKEQVLKEVEDILPDDLQEPFDQYLPDGSIISKK